MNEKNLVFNLSLVDLNSLVGVDSDYSIGVYSVWFFPFLYASLGGPYVVATSSLLCQTASLCLELRP